MSLFEDLVEELKEENLLEETVIESKSSKGLSAEPTAESAEIHRSEMFSAVPMEENGNGDHLEDGYLKVEDESGGTREFDFQQQEEGVPVEEDESEAEGPAVAAAFPMPTARKAAASPLAAHHTGETGKEYFRRRATDEVKTLQMVDHIVSRVEKEQAKINTAPFDDLKVKQALHKFLQLDDETNPSEVAEIEFLLLQETENWYSALTLRDKELSVENLRSYCESAVPSLSSQALLALARFYRNAPFSELVRSKFDLIITKLYTRSNEDGRRELTTPAESLADEILELYKEWSSVPLYATEQDEKQLSFGAMGFEDFIVEAKNAHNFDELVTKDFFKRINDFKEKANESFFAPEVVAAAVRCNVAVGNRYLELIENEYGGKRPDELKDRYGFLTDSAIAEAIRKVYTAHEKNEAKKAEERNKKKRSKAGDVIFNVEKFGSATSAAAKKKVEWYKANKKLVIATALTVAFGIFYFFFSSYILPSAGNGISKDVQVINLENSEFSKYVASAKIHKDTAYAVINDEWKKLGKTEKEQMMRRFLASGTNNGFSQINFLDSKGARVGFVSPSKLELEE